MMEVVYAFCGLVLAAFAVLTWQDAEHPHPRWSALFWALLAMLFGLGSWLPNWLSGLLLVLMVALDATGRVCHSLPRMPLPPTAGNRLAWPIACVPVGTLFGSVVCLATGWDLSRGALSGMAAGAFAAMLLAMRVTGGSPRELLDEGRRLNETIGSLSLLPQLLASLGVVLAAAGVGDWIAGGVLAVIPAGSLFWLVVANCFAMTALSALTGNSFASYPVISQGILIPLLLKPTGADASALGILTLAVGASGTLISPMAANFNLVPAALLELKDPWAVIRTQWKISALLWSVQVLIMWLLVENNPTH